jgi:hypothetical protein
MRCFTVLAVVFLALWHFSCQSDPKTNTAGTPAANTQPLINALAGQWIDIDFCSRCNQYGSVLEAQKNSHKPYAYAYAFDVNKPDSVMCFDSEKSWSLATSHNGDTLELKNANDGKSIFMIYNSAGEKDITVFDATTDMVKMDRYIKSKAGAKDGNGAFATALNHHLFNGIMVPSGSKDTIQFTSGGAILKWGPYDRFRVCAGGACFLAGPGADMITLYQSKKEGSEKTFAYKYNARADTLYLYQVTPVEGAPAKVGGVVHRFWRRASM